MTNRAEPFDIWFYLIHLCRNKSDPSIRWRADFDSRVDVDALKSAVTLSLKALPVLGCSFEGRSRKARWVKKGYTGEDMVSFIEMDNDDESQIMRHLDYEIDIEGEPLLKIFVVRRTGGDTLCAIISHLVCDGVGYKRYLYLLSELYTKLKNGRELPALVSHRRGTKPLFQGISLKERIEILRSPSKIDFFEKLDLSGGVNFKGDGVGSYILKTVLHKDIFYKLKYFGKSINATINDCLIALYARSYCNNTGTQSIMMPSTIDLRKFIPEKAAYGLSNYAGNCMCDISVQPDDTLAQTISQVSEQMRPFKEGKEVLKPILGWYLLVNLTPYQRLKKLFNERASYPVISFTNIGIIDSSLLNFDDLPISETFMTVSVKPRPFLLIAASTYNGSCTLSCNMRGSRKDAMFIEKLFDDIRKEIEALPEV
ncbi:MAG: hypothetical protein LBU32_29510 [Clostridiales bacterium]|jgi:NRPS condensation-like uncharacterized protein|nr:hypothetical protein [Clostridiales bacterium]